MLPLRAARARALLCPANLAPLAFPRNVVVIHDAAALRHPEWYSPAYAAWQRRVLPALARRALHVVTVSEFSRNELVDLLQLDPRASAWSRAASTPRSRRTPTRRPPAARSASPARTSSASRPRPRARTSRALVPAARQLAADGVEVVVAGGHRPQFAREEGLEALRHLGAVPDALLPGLYAGAEAFALPSLYEGFGLPVLEAMACGTPVIAADATALPDTAGGAARLAPPEGEAFAEAIRDVLGSTPSGAPARGRPRPSRPLHLGPDRPRSGCPAQRCESLRGAPEHAERACREQLAVALAAQPRPVERVRPALAGEPRVPDHPLDLQALARLRRAASARA